MDGMTVFLIIYMIVGWFCGWKFLKGRIAWCEKPEVPNIIVKAVLAYLVGCVICVFFLIYMTVKFVNHVGR